ncbi:unnamed protein product, partial [Ectocarpus sp. 12 AP-2014]
PNCCLHIGGCQPMKTQTLHRLWHTYTIASRFASRIYAPFVSTAPHLETQLKVHALSLGIAAAAFDPLRKTQPNSHQNSLYNKVRPDLPAIEQRPVLVLFLQKKHTTCSLVSTVGVRLE